MQYREFFCVNVRELGLVFNVDKDRAFAIGCGKFQLAANRNRADNFAVGRIYFRDVSTASIHREHAFRGRIINDRVRIGSSWNRAQSEEHTSELQSHSFISYAVFCLKKK